MTTPIIARKTGGHAPDALLGLANALTGIGEKRAACETLGKLASEFPRSAEARDGADAACGSGPAAAEPHPSAPVDAADFAACMAPLGPFEPAPRLALAVSGGADSMALALLAQGWAAERGGSVLALVVDHGLRPEAAREVALTRERLAARGIPVHAIRLAIRARPGVGRAGARGPSRTRWPRRAPRAGSCICCSATTRRIRPRRC